MMHEPVIYLCKLGAHMGADDGSVGSYDIILTIAVYFQCRL